MPPELHSWSPFPYPGENYDYRGNALKKAWPELHRGDCEPWPRDERLQEAWRCFHRGEFARAVRTADEAGLTGHAVANKATGVYATYLEEDSKHQIDCFKTAIARAERAIEAFPKDANSHYFHAFNLGRYSQSISVVKALRQGVGGKILGSLKHALELQANHAEAHTALGMYHAEIIDKVGKFIGSVTYGASESEALEHFRRALDLTPRAPIARIEYGNGLYLLFGDTRLDEVAELYETAAGTEPLDAMERLDVESAAAELE